MAGVRGRWSNSDDEQLAIQPVSTLGGWVGDTACGTLQKMIEDNKSVMLQRKEGVNGEEQGEDNDEMMKEVHRIVLRI